MRIILTNWITSAGAFAFLRYSWQAFSLLYQMSRSGIQTRIDAPALFLWLESWSWEMVLVDIELLLYEFEEKSIFGFPYPRQLFRAFLFARYTKDGYSFGKVMILVISKG
ncbi:MAG: hypothetical protein QM730_15310 [Anaerolineales bacterium]